MALFSWLRARPVRRKSGRKRARQAGRPATRRPRLEWLEERTLLSLDFGYAFGVGAAGVEQGRAIAVDTSGNVCLVGQYEGTVDFDPGAAVHSATSDTNVDAFVAKYSSAGAYAWVKALGYGQPADIALAADGSGFGTFGMAGYNPPVHRVGKLSSWGTLLWYRDMPGTQEISGTGIALGPDGAIYTTGFFRGQADFDPGAVTRNLYSAGDRDVFVSKLTASGAYVWSCSLGSTSYDLGRDVAVDASGNVYVVGSFFGTVDFDPGAGTHYLTTAGWDDAFVWKLDSAGNLVWARQLGGGPTEAATGVALDSNGDVYVTGYFWGSGDYDPGPGVYTLNSAGESDVFVCKLTAAGDFAWARSFGGPSPDFSAAIAVNSTSVYVTGQFQGAAVFDPGAGAWQLTSAGDDDAFLCQMDRSTGACAWAGQLGGPGTDQGLAIALGSSGTVYATGLFSDTGDFNPGAANYPLTSNGQTDAYLVKFTESVPQNGDIRMIEATADGFATLSLKYEIAGNTVAPFAVGLYRSADAAYQSSDELLGTVQIADAADRTVGQHTKTFTIGSGQGQVPLPGAGAAETDADYYLVAVADPANAVAEPDADPYAEDNSVAFAGAYHAPGGPVMVHGTAGDDALSATPAGVGVNGRQYAYQGADIAGLRTRGHAGNDSFAFDYQGGFGAPAALGFLFLGGPGSNTATLTGSTGSETATLYPTSGSLTAADFTVNVSGTSTVAVQSGGGSDTAWLYDSSGNDTFLASPTSASLTGAGYQLSAAGFASVYTYARNGGRDLAYLDGGAGKDKIKFQSDVAWMYAGNYYVRAKFFDEVYADGKGGTTDIAIFYDTPGSDLLAANPTVTTVTTGALVRKATAFENVTVYGSSIDTATFNDSAGNDIFNGLNHKSYLYGSGYQIVSRGFKKVTATASTGFDKARLYDTVRDDAYECRPTASKLTGGGTSGLAIEAKGFDKVTLIANQGGADTAELYDTDGDDSLEATVSLVDLFRAGSSVPLYEVLAPLEHVIVYGSTGANDNHVAAGVAYVELAGRWLNPLETVEQLVTAATGGTVSLPGGSSVTFPAGALESDQVVTLSRLSQWPNDPPNGSVTAVGSCLSVTFQPAAGGLSAPEAADFTPLGENDDSIHVVLNPGSADVPRLEGSMPAVNVVDPVEGDHFAALEGGSTEGSMWSDLSVAAIRAVSGAVNNPKLLFSNVNVSLYPDAKQPVRQYWDPATSQFKDFPDQNQLPPGVDPGKPTAVLVHGMASSASQAFGSSAGTIKTLGGYDQVVAFNYEWAQPLENSGGQLDAFLSTLKERGITNVDIWAHSEGVPVSLSGAGQNGAGASRITVDKMVLLAGPIMGSPVADTTVGVATVLANLGHYTPGPSVIGGTLQDLLDRGIGQDLGVNSQALSRIRSLFQQQRPTTKVFALAADNPQGSPDMKKLSKLYTARIFDGQPNDAVIGVSSHLGNGWDLANLVAMGPFHVSHTQITSDRRAIEAAASRIKPLPAQVIVTAESPLYTTEDGGTATFTLALDRAPLAPVTVHLHTSDAAEGIANPLSVVFTEDDWLIPVTIVVTGQDDSEYDGDQPYTVVFDPVESPDIRFLGLAPAPVQLVNLDNDEPPAGIIVAPTSGLETTEAGGTASFTVVLASRPTANVTIGLSSSDTTEGTVSPTSLVLTPDDWSQPKTVTVRGVNDSVLDADVPYTIVTASAISADPRYNGLNAPDVSVINRDNETPHAGQVLVKIVGGGYVWDSMGRINTLAGDYVGEYGANDFPFLYASDDMVEWQGISWWGNPAALTPSDFEYGLTVTAIFPSGIEAQQEAAAIAATDEQFRLLGALDLLSPLDGSSSSDTAARTRRLTSPAYVDTILIDTPA